MYCVICYFFDFFCESCSFRVVFSMSGFSCREIFSYSIDCIFLVGGLIELDSIKEASW